MRGRGKWGQGSGLRRLEGPPHTGSICSSSPSTASVWWKAAWEPITTRVAPAGKQAVQGVTPSPAPHCPPAHLGVPESVLTHPGPRRRQNLRRPARRRGRRHPQPERTDGLGSPLGLGVQMALGLLFQHSCLLPEEPPTAHQQSGVTSSRRLRIVRAPHAKAPQPGSHPFL